MSTSKCDTNLSSELAVDHVYTDFNRIFVPIFVPIIIVLGLTTNGVFLYTLYRIGEMRTITNFFLGHLAVADGCLLLDSSFQWLISYINSPLDIGFSFRTSVGCALPNLFIYVFYFASVFLVTVVIMERYVAICHPMVYRCSLVDRYQRMSIVVASFIWTISLVLAMFSLTHSIPHSICVEWPDKQEYKTFPDVVWNCQHDERWCSQCKYVLMMADLCQFLICISVVGFMSISISYCLIRGEMKSRQISIRSLDTTRARLHLSRMVMTNAFVFFVCLTPFEIINLDDAIKTFTGKYLFNLSVNTKQYIIWVGRITMIINSAINPIIYSAVNPRYREAVCRACCFGVTLNRSTRTPPRTYDSLDKTNAQELKNMSLGQNTNNIINGLDASKEKKDVSLNGSRQSPDVFQQAVSL